MWTVRAEPCTLLMVMVAVPGEPLARPAVLAEAPAYDYDSAGFQPPTVVPAGHPASVRGVAAAIPSRHR